ncbi:MAG: BRCT domain-containing protein, partial [bacterium]
SLDNLMNASYEDIESIYEIGSITAKSVYEYFRDERHKKQIDRLKKAKLNMKSEKEEPKKTNTKIAGKKFVITGTLPTLKRDEAKKLIEKYGGNITSTVSKKTDYLVIGDKPGSKYDKAKKLGITTINEEELISLTEEK